jgi:hypothetical protein
MDKHRHKFSNSGPKTSAVQLRGGFDLSTRSLPNRSQMSVIGMFRQLSSPARTSEQCCQRFRPESNSTDTGAETYHRVWSQQLSTLPASIRFGCMSFRLFTCVRA